MADGGGAGGLFSFQGRINRGTFWKINILAIVAVVLLGIGAALVVPMMAGGSAGEPGAAGGAPAGTGGVVALAFAVVIYGAGIWLCLATQARRWHDLDKSAWMVLLNFIPIVGFIAFLWAGFVPGSGVENRYGAAPK